MYKTTQKSSNSTEYDTYVLIFFARKYNTCVQCVYRSIVLGEPTINGMSLTVYNIIISYQSIYSRLIAITEDAGLE